MNETSITLVEETKEMLFELRRIRRTATDLMYWSLDKEGWGSRKRVHRTYEGMCSDL